MKKALNISLGGTLFTIEEDAYAKLEGYLNSVRARFAHTEGKEEILRDIENRIAEHFAESGKSIITLSEVESVIHSMGNADEFGEAETASSAGSASSSRKFYRDADTAIIAGVCSGLAKYFSIDVLWVRIIFAVVAITTGFGILLYILMWILVPEAKTAAQKLEMEGSPVTVNTLSESVKEKFEEVKNRHGGSFRNFVHDFAGAVAEAARRLGRLIFPIISWIFGTIGTVIAFFGLLGLTFTATLILANPNYPYFALPLKSFVSTPLLWTMVVSIFAAIAIPLGALFNASARAFKQKVKFDARIASALFSIWFISLIVSGLTIFKAADNYQIYAMSNPVQERTSEEITLTAIPNKIDVRSGIRMTYIQGTSTSLSISAHPLIMEGVEITEKDGKLSLRAERPFRLCWFCNIGDIEAVLTTPDLNAVTIKNGSRFTTENWTSTSTVTFQFENGSRGDIEIFGGTITTDVENGSSVTVNGSVATSTHAVQNGSYLELSGVSDYISIDAENGSRVEANEINSTTAKIVAAQGVYISFGTSETLDATARSGARIEYEGDPDAEIKEQSGGRIEQSDN